MVVLVSACGASPSSNPSAFCAELATRVCDQQISCDKLASSHRRDCIETVRTNLCGVRTNEANRGLFKLNPKLTTRCLADLKSKGCTRDNAYVTSACFAAIEPAAATGEKCESDQHCRNASDRCIGVGCDRTCQTAGAAGQPCRPTGTAGGGTCNAGLTCNADGQCTTGNDTGNDCGAGLPCNGSNFCDAVTDKCVALPAIGAMCRTGFPQCANTAFCSANVCTALLPAGATCFIDPQCAAGLDCRAGVCAALVAEGGTCSSSSQCVTGTTCDNVSLTCERARRVFFEEACSSTRACHGGLDCRNLKVAVGTAAGTAGQCGLAVAGDSCFTAGACPPGAFCQKSATPGMPGVCTTNSSGADCTADSDCIEAEACHTMDRKCVARTAIGGGCTLVSCGENSSCIRRGSAQVCVAAVDLNGTCSNDMVQATPCRTPLVCARSVCVSAGRKGEACIGSGGTATCFAGSCVDGICGDQRPDGATCKQDSDCLGSACERGLCVPQCK